MVDINWYSFRHSIVAPGSFVVVRKDVMNPYRAEPQIAELEPVWHRLAILVGIIAPVVLITAFSWKYTFVYLVFSLMVIFLPGEILDKWFNNHRPGIVLLALAWYPLVIVGLILYGVFWCLRQLWCWIRYGGV